VRTAGTRPEEGPFQDPEGQTNPPVPVRDVRQAPLDIVNWAKRFYNLERMHSSIDYQTPLTAESRLMTE